MYKKIVVSQDRKRLLGAVLVGDSAEYSTLLQMMLNDMPLPAKPESLILPAGSGADKPVLGIAALPDSAQICSCHNVSKGDVRNAVKNGCHDMAAIKPAPKRRRAVGLRRSQAGDGICAVRHGRRGEKDICEHFAYSRGDLSPGSGRQYPHVRGTD
ncbi:(2Fe-2S)-binding protein [Serratia ureilytica]